MRFLADENVPVRLVRELRAHGYDVLSVEESYSGIADRHVLRLAQESQTILITQDKDLASVAYLQHSSWLAGLILLRLGTLPLDKFIAHSIAAIASQPNWSGLYAVVSETAVRVRPLRG